VVPFAALVAALQDWDGVFFFQYHSSESDWYSDKVQRYFSFNGQPAKLALFTACANLYRRGDLAPLPQTAAGTLEQLLPPTLALSRRIGIDPQATAPAAAAPPADRRLASPDGRAVWDATWTVADSHKATWRFSRPQPPAGFPSARPSERCGT
jgi:hypothetical protein